MVTELALVALQAFGIGVVQIIVIVAFIGFVGLFLLTSTVKILKEYEREVGRSATHSDVSLLSRPS